MIYYVLVQILVLLNGLRIKCLPNFPSSSNHLLILSYGMQIYHNWSSHTISPSQPGYIVNVMSRLGIDTSSSTSFPTSPMPLTDMQDPDSTNPIATKNLYANSWFHIICINTITPRPIVFCSLSLCFYDQSSLTPVGFML